MPVIRTPGGKIIRTPGGKAIQTGASSAGTLTPLPAIVPSATNFSFAADLAAGAIPGAPILPAPAAGVTRTLTPGDGRITLNAAGTTFVRGLSAVTAGTITLAIKDSKAGFADSPVLTVTATVTAAQTTTSNSLGYAPNLSSVGLMDMVITGTNPVNTATSGKHLLRMADAAAWGEVPSGYKIQVTRVSDGAVMPASFHSMSFRDDGHLEKYELLLDEAAAPLAAYGSTAVAAAGAIQRYRLQAVPGSMTSATTIPDSVFTSRDLKLSFKPYNDGTNDTYWMTLSAIQADPAGPPVVNSYPKWRWEEVNSTPAMRERRYESWFIKEGSFLKASCHRWLSGVIYATALPDGTILLDCVAKYTGTHGPSQSSSTSGGTTAPRHIDGEFALFDGSTLIKSWGGQQDYRVIPVTFQTNRAVLPIGHAFGTVSPEQYRDYQTETGDVPVRFASTGTLPPGIDPNRTYYLGFDGSKSGSTSLPYICNNERGTPGYAYGGWGVNQGHNPGDVVVTYGYDAARGVYRCTQGGTTAGSGNGPQGYGGGIVDGSCIWECLNPDTSGGSGTHRIYPVVSLVNKGTQQLLDDDANPVQVGTRRTILMAGHDKNHLIKKSWLTPPYDDTSGLFPDTAPIPPYSINTYDFQKDLNNYGDNGGDKRIGWMNNTAAWGIQQPTDKALYRRTILEAVMFAGYPTQYDDERSMGPVMALLGPDYTGNTNFPGLPASNPTFQSVTNGTYGAPGWAADLLASAVGAEFQFRYQQTADASHYPVPSYGAYLRTGRTMFLDQLTAQANANLICTEYFDFNPTIAGRTFSRPQGDFRREHAWNWKAWHQCETMLPDTDPRKAVWVRQMKDQGDYFLAHIPELPEGMKRLGLWNRQYEEGFQWSSSFMPYFCLGAISMVMGRGRYPAWAQAAAHLFKFHLDYYDPQAGGTGYLMGAAWYLNSPDGDHEGQGIKFKYGVNGRWNGTDLPFMPDMATVVAYNWFGHSTTSLPDTGLMQDIGVGTTTPRAAFGGWPFQTTGFDTASYWGVGMAAHAANAMMERGEPISPAVARAPRVYYELDRRVRGYGGIIWSKEASTYWSGGYNGCYPTFSATPTKPYVAPAAATVLPGQVKNLTVSYVATDAFGVTFDVPDNSGASPRFKMEVSADGGGSYSTLYASTPQTTLRVPCSIAGSRSQTVRITAINEVGPGPAATVAATLLTPSAAPTGLHNTAIYATAIQDAWDAVAGASGYAYEWKPSSGTIWASISTSSNAVSLTGLTAGTSYDRRVSAVGPNGQGLPSAVLTSSTPSAAGQPYSFLHPRIDSDTSFSVGVLDNATGAPVQNGVLIGLSLSSTSPPSVIGSGNSAATNYATADYYNSGNDWVSFRVGVPSIPSGSYYLWARTPDGVDRLCNTTPIVK